MRTLYESRNMKRFREGLVFKARKLLYHSGLRVIKKKKKNAHLVRIEPRVRLHQRRCVRPASWYTDYGLWSVVYGLWFMVYGECFLFSVSCFMLYGVKFVVCG